MFVLLLATAIVLILGVVYAFDKTGDTFHPLMFLCPMLAFIYAWMPGKMYATGEIYDYYLENQVILIQTIALLGCTALVLGCLSALPRRKPGFRITPFPEAASNVSLKRLALGLGLIGWLGWLFHRHADTDATEGFNASGYVIELYLLTVPCIAVLLLSDKAKISRWTYLTIVFLSLPLLDIGLLDAKRGPTFMAVAALAVPWYLRRGKRPGWLPITIGATCLGVLMLFLFANRGRNWASDPSAIELDITSPFEKASVGNEYIYGGAAILSASNAGHYYWGRRYLAEILVRPIPRYVWPNKYADFGVPELELNAGTRADEFGETLSFKGAVGAAPGIVGDLWLELSWLSIPAMWVIGWAYGIMWRNAMERGGMWMVQYAILTCLSIYLVTQTMEAVIFRLLIMSLPFWLVAAYLNKKFHKQPRRSAYRGPAISPVMEPY